MPPVGFEPTISTGKGPKTYALDRTATGAGFILLFYNLNEVTLFYYRLPACFGVNAPSSRLKNISLKNIQQIAFPVHEYVFWFNNFCTV